MRHRHNLSHDRLLTGDMGFLYPAGLVEVLPGDVFNHQAALMTRLAPMASPVMHSMTVNVMHFFCPHRLVWEEAGGTVPFETFITGGPEGTDTSTVPQITVPASPKGLLYEYFGIPPVEGLLVSGLPIAGFNRIWNEFFRDQDLSTVRVWNAGNIPRVAWGKDYFTTARPTPQKGPDIQLPLGVSAPVRGIGSASATYPLTNQTSRESGGTDATYATAQDLSQWSAEQDPANAGYPSVWADLSQAVAANVRDFRRALALQRMQENRSRFGSRMVEYIWNAFKTRSPDARLQRPEYLGGASNTVSVSEVLQTGPETGQQPTTSYGVGDLYGHGIAFNRRGGYVRRFFEHGYVHTVVFVRPKSVYMNGVARDMLRRTREDFYQPELAHIGQQQVKMQEVYATNANANTVFGWSDRYQEYRYQRPSVAGDFRGNLNYWHLAREFQSEPALNSDFVECNPSKRIFNEQTRNALWMLCAHRIRARRHVVRRSNPRIL